MPQATYQDAELILKLYDLRREEKLRAARAWFTANFFAQSVGEAMEKYPPGSEPNAYFRMVLSYWDMAASFVAKGVLHEELFFENNSEMLFVWERARSFIEDFRRVRKNPLPYRNLERTAFRFIQWMNHNAPGAYESLQAMVHPKR